MISKNSIRPRFHFFATASFLCAISLAAAGEIQPADSEKTTLELKLEDAHDAARVAHQLARSFLTEAQWNEHVTDLRNKFADWERTNDGDIGVYLNTKLPGVAFSAATGKIERLKDGAIFVALYQEFRQPLPKMINEFVAENLASLNTLFGAFTWEKASAYVKNKQWHTDKKPVKAKPQE